jgi:undecaprenyl diphosphate synthase
MDGNGRWAKRGGKTRLAGHRAGADTVRKVVEAAAELGVEVLTLYAFSAENWGRPRAEVRGLFRLLVRFLESETPELVEKGIRLRAIGRTGDLPPNVREALGRSEAATAGGAGMTLCLALNYGAQDELVDAARELAREALGRKLLPDDIDREGIERHLYTRDLPPVDLLIRTGGEVRVSNFLLWQISYAELYFSPVYWPSFGREQLLEAFAEFARRERRFGRA